MSMSLFAMLTCMMHTCMVEATRLSRHCPHPAFTTGNNTCAHDMTMTRQARVAGRQAVDTKQLEAAFAAALAAERSAGGAGAPQPQPLADADVQRIDALSDGQEMRWIQTGFRLVAEARAAARLCRTACMHGARPSRR